MPSISPAYYRITTNNLRKNELIFRIKNTIKRQAAECVFTTQRLYFYTPRCFSITAMMSSMRLSPIPLICRRSFSTSRRSMDLPSFFQQPVCVAHQEGLQLFTAHFLDSTVCVTVDNFLFCHRFTSFINQRFL